MELDYRNLRDLERVTFHVQDVTQVLADVIWAEDTPFVVPDKYTAPLSAAMSAVGDALGATEEEDPGLHAELTGTAQAAVQELSRRIGAEAVATGRPSAVESILLSLHRMLRVVRTSGA
jgi:hypothetical protein